MLADHSNDNGVPWLHQTLVSRTWAGEALDIRGINFLFGELIECRNYFQVESRFVGGLWFIKQREVSAIA
jgi:hypothetical protein